MADNDRAMRLAMLSQSIEDQMAEYEKAKSKLKEEYGTRISQLRIEYGLLRYEILTGQGSLLGVCEAVAAEINTGTLDTKDIKVTATITKSKEANHELPT